MDGCGTTRLTITKHCESNALFGNFWQWHCLTLRRWKFNIYSSLMGTSMVSCRFSLKPIHWFIVVFSCFFPRKHTWNNISNHDNGCPFDDGGSCWPWRDWEDSRSLGDWQTGSEGQGRYTWFPRCFCWNENYCRFYSMILIYIYTLYICT